MEVVYGCEEIEEQLYDLAQIIPLLTGRGVRWVGNGMNGSDWQYLFGYGNVYRVTGLSRLSAERRSELASEILKRAMKQHQSVAGRLLEGRAQLFSCMHNTYPDVVFEHPTSGRWIIGDMGVKSRAFRLVKAAIRQFPELKLTQLSPPR